MARLISKRPEIADYLREQLTRVAVRMCQEQGRLLPDQPIEVQNPNPENYIYADGCVFGSPSRALDPTAKDPETGRLPRRRYDTSRGLHFQGGSDSARAAHGSKINIVCNRGAEEITRIIVAVQHQPEGYPEGEGRMLVEMACTIKKVAPGTVGVLTDGIMRGKHVQELAANGLIGVARHAARRRYKTSTIRKQRRLPKVTHGGHEHELVISDGAIHLSENKNEAGKHLTLLEPRRQLQTKRRIALHK